MKTLNTTQAQQVNGGDWGTGLLLGAAAGYKNPQFHHPVRETYGTAGAVIFAYTGATLAMGAGWVGSPVIVAAAGAGLLGKAISKIEVDIGFEIGKAFHGGH